jgi:hypothetical protein
MATAQDSSVARPPAEALDQWLREEVVAGHAEYIADPTKGVPADDILDRIKRRRSIPTAD